jgi:hypothetical protein
VTEQKVVAWLQDDVLQRLTPPNGPCRGPKRWVGRPSQLESAKDGQQSRPGPAAAGAAGTARAGSPGQLELLELLELGCLGELELPASTLSIQLAPAQTPRAISWLLLPYERQR